MQSWSQRPRVVFFRQINASFNFRKCLLFACFSFVAQRTALQLPHFCVLFQFPHCAPFLTCIFLYLNTAFSAEVHHRWQHLLKFFRSPSIMFVWVRCEKFPRDDEESCVYNRLREFVLERKEWVLWVCNNNNTTNCALELRVMQKSNDSSAKRCRLDGGCTV